MSSRRSESPRSLHRVFIPHRYTERPKSLTLVPRESFARLLRSCIRTERCPCRIGRLSLTLTSWTRYLGPEKWSRNFVRSSNRSVQLAYSYVIQGSVTGVSMELGCLGSKTDFAFHPKYSVRCAGTSHYSVRRCLRTRPRHLASSIRFRISTRKFSFCEFYFDKGMLVHSR